MALWSVLLHGGLYPHAAGSGTGRAGTNTCANATFAGGGDIFLRGDSVMATGVNIPV